MSLWHKQREQHSHGVNGDGGALLICSNTFFMMSLTWPLGPGECVQSIKRRGVAELVNGISNSSADGKRKINFTETDEVGVDAQTQKQRDRSAAWPWAREVRSDSNRQDRWDVKQRLNMDCSWRDRSSPKNFAMMLTKYILPGTLVRPSPCNIWWQ